MGKIILKPYEFKLDSENKYKIITDMKWKTLQNDGGSHVSVYYQIDLDNNIISQVQETYKANLGKEPTTKIEILYIKKIDSKISKETKDLMEEIISKETNEKNPYSFKIITKDIEKDILDKSIIESINELFTKIDKLKKQNR